MIRILADHLWQSTVFAFAAATLTLAFRNNRAAVRYWLWFAASVKFLVPFAFLLAAGRFLAPSHPMAASSQAAHVVSLVSQPFSQPEIIAMSLAPPDTHSSVPSFLVVSLWMVGTAIALSAWWTRWRRVAAIVRDGTVVSYGFEVQTLRRLEALTGVKAPIRLVRSNSTFEPGVFGIARPALIWPDQMSARLSSDQIEATLAHEVCHVQRRDNLLAAVHMFVETVFWFHPLAWWIGGRLIDERERACDEDVIALGSAPHLYSQGILKTCELCVESPLACVSGVTGSDLKRRITQIMRGDGRTRLTAARRLLLCGAASMALVLPLSVGIVTGPRLRAQVPAVDPGAAAFEVASVKPNKSGDARMGIGLAPGGRFTGTNVTLRQLIATAYGTSSDSQIMGGPVWMDSDRFDLVAKAEGFVGFMPPAQMGLRLRPLLAERFKLVLHHERRDLPIYALVVVRNDGQLGPQLHQSEVDCAALTASRSNTPPQPMPPLQPGELPPCTLTTTLGNMSARGLTITQLVEMALSKAVDRPVIDRTGLMGAFEWVLKWTPDPTAIDTNGPSIFTAVQEQLGLKLESSKGPVDVLVIDGAEPPTPD